METWCSHLLFGKSVMYQEMQLTKVKLSRIQSGKKTIAKQFVDAESVNLPVFLLTLFVYVVKIFYFYVFIERPASGVSSKRIPQLLALVAANLIYDSLVANVGPGDAAWCEQSAAGVRQRSLHE